MSQAIRRLSRLRRDVWQIKRRLEVEQDRSGRQLQDVIDGLDKVLADDQTRIGQNGV